MPISSLGSTSYMDLNQNKVETLGRVDASKAEDEKLLEVCRDFESIFVNMMLKTMRGTVDDEDSLIPKSEGTKMFETMQDEEMAKKLSMEGSSLGLAETLYSHMKASRAYGQNG